MLVFFCAGLSAQDSDKPATITIEVKDVTGAFVSNARVQIVPPPNDIGKSLPADQQGRLEIQLPPGTYEVIVASPGFDKSKKRVEVQNTTPQLISFLLAPSVCVGNCTVVNEGPPSSMDNLPGVAPNGGYAIVDVVGEREPRHAIFLEDRILDTKRKLFASDHPGAFLWNPASNEFAVTDDKDYTGNDISLHCIFSVERDVPPIPVLDLLARQLSETEREHLENGLRSRRVEIQALEWINPKKLQVEISGYDDRSRLIFDDTYTLLVDFDGMAPIWPK